jgi:hypothetical protein
MGLQKVKEDLYAKGFSSMEVKLGGMIFTAIVKATYSQSLEEGWVKGAYRAPQARTEGELKEGTGELEFAMIDQATDFIEALGDGYLDQIWNATFTYWRVDQKTTRDELFECRLLDVKKEPSQGVDAIGATMPFSYKTGTINGLRPIVER